MTSQAFPRLTKMMGGWINQDYDFEGLDDAGIIASYAQSTMSPDLAATMTEIDTLLAMPTRGLLERFIAETGFGNMLISDSDKGARQWLFKARELLALARHSEHPST